MVQKRDLSVKVKKRFNTVQWGILTKYSVFNKKKWYIVNGRLDDGNALYSVKKAVTHHSEDDHQCL